MQFTIIAEIRIRKPSRPAWASASSRVCASNTEMDAGASGKGIAPVEPGNGEIRSAETHWYEATGIGKREFKIKRFLSDP